MFRACPDPVISCGILFLRGIFEPLGLPVDPATLSVLMVRRKDSMSYMEFVRGKYDTHDTEYIKKLLSNVTVQEQKYILEEPFEALWKRLWGNSRDIDSFEYNIARDKFNSLDLKSLIIPSQFSEPEWGFPKGRRSRGETDLECAVREFWEETNIPESAYNVLETTFTENFVATNNIHYKHKYFVAVLKDSKMINLNQKLTPAQRREVSSVEWKSLAECKRITRPHYVDRKRLITELERTVSLGFK